jgi:hypothetical protein
MPRFRSRSAVALAMLPALGLGIAPGHLDSSHGQPVPAPPRPSAPEWQLAESAHFGQPGNASGYSAMLVVDGHVWAFGGTNPGGQSVPVALSQDGRGWRASTLPAGLTGFISDVSASSATDIWAVSGYGRYVLRFDGTRWQLFRPWRRPGVLSDVMAFGPGDAWVFGTSAGGSRTIGTWRYDGSRWIEVRGIARDIYRASAVSRRDIWAIVAGSTSDTIVHFSGGRWHRVKVGPALAGIRWHDIVAESATSVWLAGNEVTRHGGGTLILAHFNGRNWTRFDTSQRAWAGQLAAADHGRIAVTATSAGLLSVGLIALVSPAGRMSWSRIIVSAFGSGVSDVSFAPGTGVLWASGGILTRLGGNAAVWQDPIARPDAHGTTRRPASTPSTGGRSRFPSQ